MKKILCNGIEINESRLSALLQDYSFQRGYGAFERLRTYGGVPFCLSEHLSRLKKTAETLRIGQSVSFDEIAQIIKALHDSDDFGVRIYITAGTESRMGDVYIIMEPLPEISSEAYLKGIHAITTTQKRFLPEIKTINYTAAQFVLRTTLFQDVEEVIYLDEWENVLEGGTSNIFGVVNGLLCTAPEGVLPGITRGCILKLFPGKIQTTPFRVEEMEECFLTSSIREVMPITMIDGKPVGDGGVGPYTKEVMEMFSEAVLTEVSTNKKIL